MTLIFKKGKKQPQKAELHIHDSSKFSEINKQLWEAKWVKSLASEEQNFFLWSLL